MHPHICARDVLATVVTALTLSLAICLTALVLL